MTDSGTIFVDLHTEGDHVNRNQSGEFLAGSQTSFKQVVLNARDIIFNVRERSPYFVMLTHNRLKFANDRQAAVKLGDDSSKHTGLAPNENKISHRYRERASLEMKVI